MKASEAPRKKRRNPKVLAPVPNRASAMNPPAKAANTVKAANPKKHQKASPFIENQI